MVTHLEDKKNSSLVITYKVSKDEFQKNLDKEMNNFSKKVRVPGYRPGKAPKEKLLQYTNKTEVMNFVISTYSKTAFQEVVKYITEKKLNANAYYSTNVDFNENGDLILSYDFPLLPDYSKVNFDQLKTDIKLPKLDKKAKEEIVKKFINEGGASTVLTDKKEKTKLNDVVNIDFKGFINDEAFEGGEAEGFDLTLGSNQFIHGFEDQLVGKATGWNGDIKVVFPETYFVKEYQNKEAVFNVKINSIKRHSKLELTEEFVKKLNIENVKTVKEFEEFLVNKKLVELFFQSISEMENNLVEEINKISNPIIHKNLLAKRIKDLENEFNKTLKQYGIKRTEYLSLIKTTEENIQAEYVKIAEDEAKKAFAQDWLVQQLNINEKDEELIKFKEELKQNGFTDEKNLSATARTIVFTRKLLEKINSKKIKEFDNLSKDIISLK
ncbi:trigger factor [Mycoplasmopsis felis]|uniref:trigger factor n=1 Tax=Mycoplasmopsis felis TaxID=33923 RepID=UPI002B003130|nr:trigger factor [Mycoplasmopsis felis]WQQ06027.1 trigger factor [Mycoplasmopsis felis]